ncbi:style cell-cycle inhibitor 1-A isoform X1 [Cannabis sativa]|uniref:style cell-cycle inhibitor 1-A isoform X1 n=1 Tax=Cannabis sativa TaxID=3483 RepID=UPI0029CA0F21|nr:style cell-cycle inhibitor 1-A isoform X1 [Cannabis sativa]
MGSERISEKKQKTSRKRSSSPSPSPSQVSDEGRRKRHKSVEDEERKSRKKSSSDKKERHKDKKSHKRHSETDKDKKLKDKHKDKDGKGDQMNYEFKELTKDDYFSKNNEFATWLKDKKKIFFSDLSAEAARDMFTDFIKAWNKHKLDSRYYEGIVSGPRTAHKWKIKA